MLLLALTSFVRGPAKMSRVLLACSCLTLLGKLQDAAFLKNIEGRYSHCVMFMNPWRVVRYSSRLLLYVQTASKIALPKPAILFNERFMAGRHEEKCCEKNHPLTISCLQRSIERLCRDSKGHRISGDTAESWFPNRRFR